MDISDYTLPELIERKDYLNILRYIRTHKLRQPQLVLNSARSLLGQDLSKRPFRITELARLAILEQTCLAALDNGEPTLADTCLQRLAAAGIAKDSVRYRLLLARCLEYTGAMGDAEHMYDACLAENPANALALARKVCIAASSNNQTSAPLTALHSYLAQHYHDAAAWHHLAQLHRERGNWGAAGYCLEHVVRTTPAVRMELAECYASAQEWGLARTTMAAVVEQDPQNVRAWMGLLSIANQCVLMKSKNGDEMEWAVAEELVRLGAEKVLALYKTNTTMFPAVQKLVAEYRATD